MKELQLKRKCQKDIRIYEHFPIWNKTTLRRGTKREWTDEQRHSRDGETESVGFNEIAEIKILRNIMPKSCYATKEGCGPEPLNKWMNKTKAKQTEHTARITKNEVEGHGKQED
jgi:hypothetical protein